MLAQRLRRWPDIKTSLFQRVVFAGIYIVPTKSFLSSVAIMIVQKAAKAIFTYSPPNHHRVGCGGCASIVRGWCDVLQGVDQGLNLESCVWRAVSSHHPQEVLLAQFSLYVRKSGLCTKARFISFAVG